MSGQPHDQYIKYVPKGRTMQRISRVHTWLYRLTGGRIGGYADRLNFLLLTSVGRKSGLERTTPLPFWEHPERSGAYVSVGSNGGRDAHAAWFHNVNARPEVEIQIRSRRFSATARVATADERERLWKHIVAQQPRYDDYQAQTQREIPVVVFEAQ